MTTAAPSGHGRPIELRTKGSPLVHPVAGERIVIS
jgi:hypothetical protein